MSKSTNTILILVALAGAAFAGYWFIIRPKMEKPKSSVQAEQKKTAPPPPTKAITKPLPPVKSTTGSMVVKAATTACKAGGYGAACDVAAPIVGKGVALASSAAKKTAKTVSKLKFW